MAPVITRAHDQAIDETVETVRGVIAAHGVTHTGLYQIEPLLADTRGGARADHRIPGHRAIFAQPGHALAKPR